MRENSEIWAMLEASANSAENWRITHQIVRERKFTFATTYEMGATKVSWCVNMVLPYLLLKLASY